MSRRLALSGQPAVVGFYAALAAAGMQGTPAPYSVSLYPASKWDPAGWADLWMATADELWAWASLLKDAPVEKFSDTGVSIGVSGMFAGIPVKVTANCNVDHPYTVNNRDREADVRDLAAAVAAGEIAGSER